MNRVAGITKASIALGFYVLTSLVAGCVVAERREGYWDRDHQRWWHEHGWVQCGREDEHCRER